MLNPDETCLASPAADPGCWLLDPNIVYLNHGAFGACPKRVLEVQNEWRVQIERQPLRFLVRELETHLDSARETLSAFVGADADNLVFVPNATHGVNTVLRSLRFNPADELLVTDHEYNASRNALDFVASQYGAKVVVVHLPFPFRRVGELIDPIVNAVTSKTRLALIDHVTSQTGIVMPLQGIVAELTQRGVDTLVDGAHAPGMISLNLKTLDATYYAGNCHKWLCGPRGAAFLHVQPERQKLIRPLTISHGASSDRKDRSRFLLEFGWQGTFDPSAALSVPEAIRFMACQCAGGWFQVMARNHALAVAARKCLSDRLGMTEPCPEEFIGSMASVPLSVCCESEWPRPPLNEYPFQDVLREKYRIEVPMIPWPVSSRPMLRISAQLYNSLPQYQMLAAALENELGKNCVS